LFALLSMFGLAFGIASAILIFLYVSDELQYDTVHPSAEHTYHIGVRFTNADGRVF
jgi:putative ABC transport system permease protein